jgi:hypothetical protein
VNEYYFPNMSEKFMKYIGAGLVFLLGQHSFSATKSECLSGDYSACKDIFNQYGRSSEKIGAIEFFGDVCASQNLKVTCEVFSIEKSETLRKTLELGRAESSIFIMSGAKVDKLYRLSSLSATEALATKEKYIIQGADKTKDSPARSMEL